MKKWKFVLLCILLVALVAAGYYFFNNGLWTYWRLRDDLKNILNLFAGPILFLTAASVLSLIIMIKRKNIILPTLLVFIGVFCKYTIVFIDAFYYLTFVSRPLMIRGGYNIEHLSFDPILILIDFIFKTAVIILPALIIYGCINIVRYIKNR